MGRPFVGQLADLVDAVGSAGVLAELLETSPRTISRWSNGEQDPDGPARFALRTLCERLGVPVPELAERQSPEPTLEDLAAEAPATGAQAVAEGTPAWIVSKVCALEDRVRVLERFRARTKVQLEELTKDADK